MKWKSVVIQILYYNTILYYNPDTFQYHMSFAPWSVLEIFDHIDDKLHAFDLLFNEILDHHAPIRSIKVHGKQNPCITEEIRELMKSRTIQGFWYFARSRTREIQVFLRNHAKFPPKREIPRNPPEIFPNTCRQNIFNTYIGHYTCFIHPKRPNLSWNFVTETSKQRPKTTRRS